MIDDAGMIVLAGGRSRRMGTDKAWLPVGDRPALLHVVEQGLEAGVSVVVVGAPGRSLPPLPAGVVRVDDPQERTFEGPLSGLAVGLQELATQSVAFACLASCDALWMVPEHIEHVVGLLERDPEGPAAVVPADPPVGNETPLLHPLCGAVRVRPALAAAKALLGEGRRAARELMRELGAQTIAVGSLPEPRVADACNTRTEWDAAVAARGVGTGPGVD